MLKSPVYNDCATPEMLNAFRNRDREDLKRQILWHCQLLLSLDAGGMSEEAAPKEHRAGGRRTNFHLAAARLQTACSLYDSLKGGHATAFVTDFINI